MRVTTYWLTHWGAVQGTETLSSLLLRSPGSGAEPALHLLSEHEHELFNSCVVMPVTHLHRGRAQANPEEGSGEPVAPIAGAAVHEFI